MAKLISLFSYGQESEKFLPYLIIQCSKPKKLQTLSPDIMKINEGLFVVDFSSVKNYWQKVAQTKKLSLTEQLKLVVQNNFGVSSLAVFCQHPFQGLIFFNHLKLHNSQGLFDYDTLFARKLYNNLSWEPWILSARQINSCFERESCLRKERQSFSTQLQSLIRFVERTDLQDFASLKQAHFFEISRRFQSFIGKLWQWTFPTKLEGESEKSRSERSEETLCLFHQYESLLGFPWIPFFNKEKIKIENWLEYPLSEWEQLLEPLYFDFEKLCDPPSLQPPHKILQMTWTLTLFDMSQVRQSLQFRHPLCLEEEKQNEFSTLYKQLHFAFDRFKEQMQERAEELEIANIALIVGWQLQVDKTLILSERNQFLQPEEEKSWSQKQDLAHLSNKVKTPLQAFTIEENFIPGLDFVECDLEKEPNAPLSSKTHDLLRPFYIFSQEQGLDSESIKSSQFLERTSSDWWNRQDPFNSYRDCYLCELENRKLIFAYRNYLGEWFQYGI